MSPTPSAIETALPTRLARRLMSDGPVTDLAQPVALTAQGVLTNKDFLSRCAAWTEAFSLANVSCVALFSENTVDFLCATFGAWRANVRTVFCADALPATLDKLIDANLIDAVALDFGSFCANHSDKIAIVTPVSEEALSIPLFAAEPLNEDAPLAALFTSGTTGEAKLESKRLSQLFLECEEIDQIWCEKLLKTDEYPVFVGTVTHQHIYGVLWRALLPLLGRGLITQKRCHFPETLAKELASHPCCVLITSPAHLKRLDWQDANTADWQAARQSVRLVVSSAGQLDDDGARRSYKLLGRMPFDIFGSTETGGIAYRIRYCDDKGEMVTPAWQPMPGINWRINDEGVLTVKGPHLKTDDWETGADRAAASQGGFILLGRSDRIVKIEGKRVSLSAIEKRLATLPGWHSVKAVTLTSGKRESIGIVVELTVEAQTLLREVGKKPFVKEARALLQTEMEAVMIPRFWRFVSSLPTNEQGKSTVAALQALFDNRRPEWIQKELTSQKAVYEAICPSALRWFKGHFPDCPILPGVAQLTLAEDLAREAFHLRGHVSEVKTLKFKAVTPPGKCIRMTLLRSEREKCTQTLFTMESVLKKDTFEDLTLHAQGTLCWEDD